MCVYIHICMCVCVCYVRHRLHTCMRSAYMDVLTLSAYMGVLTSSAYMGVLTSSAYVGVLTSSAEKCVHHMIPAVSIFIYDVHAHISAYVGMYTICMYII